MRNFLIFVILISTNSIFSQNPFFTAIDKTTGLPSNSVYDIFQDSKGFMWFATGKGLCRYDGNNFKTFTADFQTSKSGSCIMEDKYGRIWYENFDGFLNYVENGNLKAFPQKTSLGYFRYGIVNNTLFLMQPDGVFVYDLKTLKFKTKHIITDKKIKFCYATVNNFYVLGDFFYEFKDEKNFIKLKLPLSFEEDIKGPIINHWNEKLLINSKNNCNYYIFEDGKFSKHTLKNAMDFIQNTAIIGNSVWLCTPNGVYKNDLISNAITSYFPSQNISFVYNDKHNNYWLSTLNDGVMFVQDFSYNYINLQPRPLSLSLGKNEIFIGTEKDLVYKLNSKNLEVSKIYETESNHSIGHIFADTISNNLFYSSYKFNVLDKNNQLTNEYKIAIKDIKKVDEKYFSFAASSVSGIFCVNKNLKSSWDFIFKKNKTNSFSGFNQVYLLKNCNGKSTEYNNYNNTIYYAANNGLIAITGDGKIKEIKYNNKTLFLSRIQKYGDFIIGVSTSEKLYIIDSKNIATKFNLPVSFSPEKFNKFFVRSDYCYLFSEDSVFEYDFQTKNIRKIMSLGNDIEATDVILKNNHLLFATSKGIVIKNRKDIELYPTPKLVIDAIYVNGKKSKISQIKTLKSDENDVAIYLAALSFLPNVDYKILYKINESEWKTLESKDGNLKLSSLAAGSYSVFFAINYNNAKVDLQNIQFEIMKPFWINPLTFFGLGIFVLLGFYFFYKRQIKKMKRQNEQQVERINLESKLNESKLIAIKSQMNPHFFYNALNTIQSYILSNDKKMAISYLSKFSTLTRYILEMTEQEYISVADEIKTLALYLDIEKARFSADFEYEITTMNINDLEHTKIPSMFLQPYVENAVKHGLLHKEGSKKVKIDFTLQNDRLHITIDDNGIGRVKSDELNTIKNKKHKSFATAAMEKRIDILNKTKTNAISLLFIDKKDNQGIGTGTTVKIEIPT